MKDPSAQPDSDGPRERLSLPSLGPTVRGWREARRLSRPQAVTGVPLSATYLEQIETGVRVPAAASVRTLAVGLGLDDEDLQHLTDLQAPAVELPPVAELRRRLGRVPALLQRLDDLAEAGLVAAYLDPGWNVVAANTLFRTTLPGLAESACGAAWWFGPVARALMTDWDDEALRLVRLLRADLARHRWSPVAAALLRIMERDSDFHHLWRTDLGIAHGRTPADPMRLTEADTGEPIMLSIETNRLDSMQCLRHFLAVRKPDPGPIR